MICINRNDPPEEYTFEENLGLFHGLSEQLKNCDVPDPEIILLIHKWVMGGLEHAVHKLELDAVEAMAGQTKLRLMAKSGENWVTIDITFGNKLLQRLHLNFNQV